MVRNDPRYPRGHGDPAGSPDFVPTAVRAAGLTIGIAMLVLGAYCMVRIFGGVYAALAQPSDLTPMVEQWNELIDGSKLSINYEKESIPLGKIVSVFCMGLGAMLMISISGTLVSTGTKIVIACLDQEAYVRRMLNQILGYREDQKRIPRNLRAQESPGPTSTDYPALDEIEPPRPPQI